MQVIKDVSFQNQLAKVFNSVMSTNIKESLENDDHLRPDSNGICYEDKLATEHEKLIELTQILVVHPDLKDIPVPADENLNDEILAKVSSFFSISCLN